MICNKFEVLTVGMVRIYMCVCVCVYVCVGLCVKERGRKEILIGLREVGAAMEF